MSKLRILVVDDNEMFRGMLRDVIRGQDDMEVVAEAGDGREALGLIRQCEPDVVLLDVIMPQLDGIGVMERLSQEPATKRPMVFVLSAVVSDGLTEQMISLGASYYVAKTCDLNQVGS